MPARIACSDKRKRHPAERARGTGAEITARFEQRPVDPVEGPEQRQDHEGHVPVDQAHDQRERLACEPWVGLVQHADRLQRLVHVAVVLQQGDPGQHPQHVGDPERREERDEEQSLVPPAVPGEEVGDGVADQQAEHRRDPHEHDRVDERRVVQPVGVRQVRHGELQDRRVPVHRVPVRDRLTQDLVRRAEGDGQHHVEREHEEHEQVERGRRSERRPEPAWGPGPARHPPRVQRRRPATARPRPAATRVRANPSRSLPR